MYIKRDIKTSKQQVDNKKVFSWTGSICDLYSTWILKHNKCHCSKYECMFIVWHGIMCDQSTSDTFALKINVIYLCNVFTGK